MLDFSAAVEEKRLLFDTLDCGGCLLAVVVVSLVAVTDCPLLYRNDLLGLAESSSISCHRRSFPEVVAGAAADA